MSTLPQDANALSLGEPLSPELALVDPELARRARAVLPNPGEKEALARLAAKHDARTSGLTSPPATSMRRVRRRAGVAAAVAALLAALVVLADLRVEIGKTTAAADATEPVLSDRTTATPPPQPTPRPSVPSAPRGRGGSRAQVQAAQPQRFAWAPVAGASGYRIELFRGPARIFRADTRRATLTLPARWRHAGRNERLRPGSYRWYVWPLLAGRRAARAVVQASVTVGRD